MTLLILRSAHLARASKDDVPGAMQRETLLRRTGTVADAEFGMAPDQRSGVKNAAPRPGTLTSHSLWSPGLSR